MSIIKNKNAKNLMLIEPLVSVQENDKEVILEAEMVGLEKNDIDLEVKNGELILKGRAKKEETVPKGYTVLYKERCPLEYKRVFMLSDEINKEKIEATYENGVLRVRLEKSESSKPKKIDIKS